tara:strand:- start:3929 stop:4234 length:306 start_codon:yes stop_codon:yes gene_type:complete
MYKELIKIGKQNIQGLKSCLNIAEAHLWNGTRAIKTKYTKHKIRLNKKLREEQFYVGYYEEKLKKIENFKGYSRPSLPQEIMDNLSKLNDSLKNPIPNLVT